MKAKKGGGESEVIGLLGLNVFFFLTKRKEKPLVSISEYATAVFLTLCNNDALITERV